MINCSTRQIELATKTCRHVALSYVWGPPVTQPREDNLNGGLPNLPRTVEDAILVTLQLGYHYLRVDRYCIDQNHGDDKKIQINQMDLIYQEAEVTIIATAGEDPSFSLPNVTPSQPRVGPVKVNVRGLRLSAIIYPINRSKMIEESK